MLESNEHGCFFPSVHWLKTARMLLNILIGASKLYSNGGFAQITQMPSNTHIMEEIFTIFHN